MLAQSQKSHPRGHYGLDHIFRMGELMRTFVRLLAAATILSAAFVYPSLSSPEPAQASHNKGTYGNHGYVWFARYDDNAIAWVSSTDCNKRETDAYERITNSTDDAFNVRWPSGIRLSQQYCDGRMNAYVDIKLIYDSNFTQTYGNYGGFNVSTKAPQSWCDTFGAPYPCGYHPSVVRLNRSRFFNNNWSHNYRERLIMHETGHSLGMSHVCSQDSIMNDGTSDCNGGRWTAVMVYKPTDHQAIRDTYPNWKYQ